MQGQERLFLLRGYQKLHSFLESPRIGFFLVAEKLGIMKAEFAQQMTQT